MARLATASCVADSRAQIATEETATRLGQLGSYLKYRTGDPLLQADGESQGWVAETDLEAVDTGPQVRLMSALGHDGFGGNRWALSASLLLRYGWSSGLQIGMWLMSGRVTRGAALILRFTPTAVLAEVAVADAGELVEGTEVDRRVSLVTDLVTRAAPIVEAHHVWSGFSRRALWSMVTSSWAAQCTHISEMLGEPERGLAEGLALVSLNPQIAAAAPDIYMVRANGRKGVCQMRRLCCLWFKGPKRQFCASCPIIDDDDRLSRNRSWIAERGLPDQPAA